MLLVLSVHSGHVPWLVMLLEQVSAVDRMMQDERCVQPRRAYAKGVA